VGLALSGGGIRSASFCLGVVQALSQRGLLDDVDYLSTVSGGGYTGSFVTSTLVEAGTTAALIGSPDGPDTEPIGRLRANAKYLSSEGLAQSWSRVTATLAGMLLNSSGPFLFLSLAGVAAAAAAEHGGRAPWPPALGLVAMALIAYGAAMRVGERCAAWAGRGLAGAFGLAAVLGVSHLVAWGHTLLVLRGSRGWGALLVVALILLAVPVILRFVPFIRDPQTRQRVLMTALLAIGALVVPFLGLAVFYSSWDWATPLIRELAAPEGASLSAGGLTSAVNVNLTGPHRMYRDAIAATFIRRPELPLGAIGADDTGAVKAPYHLVNATVARRRASETAGATSSCSRNTGVARRPRATCRRAIG
jgi:hypothetical protein